MSLFASPRENLHHDEVRTKLYTQIPPVVKRILENWKSKILIPQHQRESSSLLMGRWPISNFFVPLLSTIWAISSHCYIVHREGRHFQYNENSLAHESHASLPFHSNPFVPRQPTQIPPSGTQLKATPSMCFHCFDTLLQNLRLAYPHLQAAIPDKGPHSIQNTPAFVAGLPQTNKTIQCPLFVTWEKEQSNNRHNAYELRGCIGNLQPLPLVSGLTKYALLSALQDTRFSPIAPHELPHLRVGVSLLVYFEACQHAYDWTVGVHGIIIRFQYHGATYSATYLPEVAAEQGWDPPTAVETLIRKAGFRQVITPAVVQSIQCTRYQSSKCKRTFADFLQQPENHELVHIASTLQHQQAQLTSSGRFRRRHDSHSSLENQQVNAAGCNLL